MVLILLQYIMLGKYPSSFFEGYSKTLDVFKALLSYNKSYEELKLVIQIKKPSADLRES